MPSLRRWATVSALPVLAALAVTGGCSDRVSPTAVPTAPQASRAAFVSASGNPYVHLLAPLGSSERFSGAFDPSLALEIVVYQGAAAPCAPPSTSEDCPLEVAHFRGPDSVRVDGQSEQYVVKWDATHADRHATYRILVRVGEQVLDYFDVSGIKGGTVPIKLRIDQGALQVARAPVGTDGGVVAAAGGDLSLSIPAGALLTETSISVAAVEPVQGRDDRVVGGREFEFGPDGTRFAHPVTVTVKYDPLLLPAGISAKLLRLHTLVNGAWVLVPGSTVDPQTSTVTAETSHFSTYAILPLAFTSVGSGEFHACGLTADGSAWCWGANGAGQLGAPTSETCNSNGDPAPCSTVAVRVQGGLHFSSVEAGSGHTCGVTTEGDVYCWGTNRQGQLGTGDFVSSPVPVKVASAEKFQSVAAEYLQSCALTVGGDVYCWGGNSTGQLGGPSSESCGLNANAIPCSSTPLHVAVPAAVQLDVGLVNACARTSAGAIYCWGSNRFGQIGDGTIGGFNVPPTPVSGGPWTVASAGAVHNCAIDGSGTGYCWGLNFGTGALGDGSNTNHPSPIAIAGGLTLKQIDATNGNYIFTHSCAVTTSDQAYCWGSNRDGALGVQTAPSQCQIGSFPAFDCALTPIPVSGGLSFQYVTAGLGFTCGYTTAGDVYCWGMNDRGQLGNGTTSGSRAPVKVAVAP